MSAPEGPAIDMLLASGPEALGCAFDWILMGILASQIATYLQRSWRKEPAMNLVVLLLAAMAATSACMDLAALWFTAIPAPGSPTSWLIQTVTVSKLFAARWTFLGTRIMTAQLAFCYRLYRVSGWRLLCGVFALLVIAMWFETNVPTYMITQGHSVDPLFGTDHTTGIEAVGDYSNLNIIASLGLDIVLTGSLTYFLLRKRDTASPLTDSLLNRLAQVSLSNACICTLLNLAVIIALHVQPVGATFHSLFGGVSATMFSICLLYSLNQRSTLARDYDPNQISSSSRSNKTSHPLSPGLLSPSLAVVHMPSTPSSQEDEKADYKDERRFVSSTGGFSLSRSQDELPEMAV